MWQMGLLAHTERGQVLFAADGCWLRRAIRENRPPARATAFFVDDMSAVRDTIERLHHFALACPDVKLVPCHCPEAFREEVEQRYGLANFARLAQHFVRANWRWQHLQGAALERYQEERAQRMVAYAQAHSPFYRTHWAGHDLRQWRLLPTVDKAVMMEHFSTFNTRGISHESCDASGASSRT